ncbi:MAG: phosphate ABC transporter ATP-binding protein PstB, partial [Promethearchaeota archaeon]
MSNIKMKFKVGNDLESFHLNQNIERESCFEIESNFERESSIEKELRFVNESKINREYQIHIISTSNLNLWYGNKQALEDVNINIEMNKVTALIGPSGCGKSTLIRCFNRLNDVFPNVKITGEIKYDNFNILTKKIDLPLLRKQIGIIFQKPNPFPMSIFDNVAYGPRIQGIKKRKKLNEIVEKALKMAALWEEVSDRMEESALGLSGGQQQRLCIARALAVKPTILLMDEPTSALDPIASAKIEDLINKLKETYTIIIVTHNMQQAARISDYTGFLYMGKLIEFGKTQ